MTRVEVDPIEAATRRGLSPRVTAGQTFEPLDEDARAARRARVRVIAVAGDVVTVQDAWGREERLSAEALTTTCWIVRSAA